MDEPIGSTGDEQAAPVLDSIADNAGNAALIIGGRPVKPMDMDLRMGLLRHRNNVIEESVLLPPCSIIPPTALPVANKLAPFDIALEPGRCPRWLVHQYRRRAPATCSMSITARGSISSRFV
jgi:2-oxo-hept-3-ene-1,7-dioate hydratase